MRMPIGHILLCNATLTSEMATSQEAGSGKVDTVAPEEATASSSPVEHVEQAVRIVSNLPAAFRDTPEGSQDAWVDWNDDADEDDDGDEDIDIGELEEDMAELEAELDQDEWDEHDYIPGQAPHEIAGDLLLAKRLTTCSLHSSQNSDCAYAPAKPSKSTCTCCMPRTCCMPHTCFLY
jgi:hypothetical protein